VVVSITSPDSRPARLAEGYRDVLRMAFWDLAAPCQWGGETLLPISRRQAEAIVAFLERWHAHPESLTLLVHCEAGISRSAAVARYASERYRVPVEDIQPDCPWANSEVLRQLRQAAGMDMGPDLQQQATDTDSQ